MYYNEYIRSNSANEKTDMIISNIKEEERGESKNVQSRQIHLGLKKYLLISVVTILVIVSAVPMAFASSSPSAGCKFSIVNVAIKTDYHGSSNWNCVMNAKTSTGGAMPSHSWASSVFSVTLTTRKGMDINVTDAGRTGNFYQVWMTIDPTLKTGWKLLGSTPQVHSGKQLIAPTHNSLWDGKGVMPSMRTFANVTLSAGKTYFAVTDSLFSNMGSALNAACGKTTIGLLTQGCSVKGVSVASNWNPESFIFEVEIA